LRTRLFTLAAGASLTLCLAAAGLWARSHWRQDGIDVFRLLTWWQIQSNSGVVLIHSNTWPEDGPSGTSLEYCSDVAGGITAPPAFSFGRGADGPRAWRDVRIRHWLLVAGMGVLPIAWIARHRGRPRIGHCPACGYDLRATPDRCPECGAVPPGR